ncbi:MAG: fumarate hydratase [Candidatus Thorarchaeota archaeon]
MVTETKLQELIVELMRLATTDLPEDVERAIRKYRENEIGAAKAQMDAIIKDFEMARETSTVMCQDSGFPIFYVKIGQGFELPKTYIGDIIEQATIKATQEIPLRPNTVDMVKGVNPGDNSGKFAPFINYELIDTDYLEICYSPKGGGSSNMSALGMLKPGQGLKGVKEFILKTVINAHSGQPCNPIVVSAAVGGGEDVAMKIAKKNVFYRKVGEPNPDPVIAKMEEELLEAINQIGYGPMGLGGKTTALDVYLDFGMRHPASLPVGVVIQCWANRRAIARCYNDGRIEILSHKAVLPELTI